MVKINSSRPPLEASLTVLKHLLRQDVLQQSPGQAADLYRAAIHLLGALKEDQALLCRIERENKNNSDKEAATCPSYEIIPAISAVVNDVDFFRALVRCLQTATATGDVGENNNVAISNVLGRKRSMSMSGEPSLTTAGKAAKLSQHHLSPVPQQVRNKAVGRRPPGNTTPSFDVRVFAATCLYTSFQHLDHWPVPLVRAYAEDCFGPRLWVDLPQCAALVENLALVHQADDGIDGNMSNSKELTRDAVLMFEAYDKFESDTTEMVDNGTSGGVLQLVSLDEATEKITSDTVGVRWHHSSLSSGSFESTGSRNGLNRDNQQWRNGGGNASDSASEGNKKTRSSCACLETQENDGGNAPSSGDDDQDAVAMTRSEDFSFHDKMGRSSMAKSDTNGDNHSVTPQTETIYPLSQRNLNIARVRQRFYGKNLEAAHAAIVSTLTDRVDVKSKQNSNLLQCLPSFTSIPGIRCQIAANLEKWLQSPALAGRARTLFSSTVNSMKNTDPPLDEDLKAIDSIISMRLKANQLNTHIGNVTAIARRIPVASVASHLYSKLLRNLLVQTDVAITSAADSLKMINAIHREIPPKISYDSIAAGLLTMLAQPMSPQNIPAVTDAANTASPVKLRSDRSRLVKKLRGIIRSLSDELGAAFNGTMLIEALQSFDLSTVAWSARDEEDKARLMLQCVTMTVSLFLEPFERSTLSTEQCASLRKLLAFMRRFLLEWCCTEYGPRFSSKHKRQRVESVPGELPVSWEPMFSSVLGPSSGEREMPLWLIFMRCLLLLEDPDSDLMRRFIFPDDSFTDADESAWAQEIRRLRVCCCFGRDLSDEALWIVLRSASMKQAIEPDMSIQILEHLFQGCDRKSTGLLSVSDPSLVWEMYNLILLSLPVPISLAGANDSENGKESSNCRVGKISREIPRLAHPGLWWRVTVLALVMCGHSPTKLGTVMWEEHPTLRALMTMVTAGRFRFPTIDCDEETRAEMKRLEQAARDSETSAAEILFLPPKQEAKRKEVKGSRVSRRLLNQQQEKKAAHELEERARRKTLLRAAQKTIMLWDPHGPARKPPREAVDLLFSVDELFQLSDTFKKSTDPDFLLMTIGKTNRGAIERAYEWLIPIISILPMTISRLPSSASCFLLLRAYGTEGDERKQLKELASPLLQHVKDSLNGKYGKTDAVKAFDLLMADVASSKRDRRRCARRVLQDALAKPKASNGSSQQWMLNVLELDGAQALVGDAVKHMSTAASFEQGGVLRSIVIALEKHIVFAQQSGIFVERSFCELLVRLISNRPSVFAAAMESYTDLRSLAVRVLFSSFVERSSPSAYMFDSMPSVAIKLFESEHRESGTVHLPLTLLQSICVVLSIWKDADSEYDKDVTEAVDKFVRALLRPDDDIHSDVDCGLASAKTKDGGAVAVESWIMLAKSRSDTLAKRAALSAPSGFLPRLLFCSSLPRAPFVAMVDRLGRLGDAAGDKEELYGNMMSPSALSEWDIGRIGLRRDVARKLLGRLSAYIRIHDVCLSSEVPGISTTFLSWLTEECTSNISKSAKAKIYKKAKATVAGGCLSSMTAASFFLSTLENDVSLVRDHAEITFTDADLDQFQDVEQLPTSIGIDYDVLDLSTARSHIISYIKSGQFMILNKFLELFLAKSERNCLETKSDGNEDLVEVSVEILKSVYALQQPKRGATDAVLTWIPRLSSASGSPALWNLIFGRAKKPSYVSTSGMLLTRCMQSWSIRHIAQCMDWIMGIDHNASNDFDYEGIASFLVACSGQPSAQIELFADLPGSYCGWTNSNESVSTGTLIAFRGLKQIPIKAAIRCHSVPPGFTLIFLLSRCGKKHLRSICDMILEELSEADAERPRKQVLEVLLLRLYLNFPQWMDLGSSESRNALMRASESFSSFWTNWLSSFDDRIDDLLQSICNGEMKSVKHLADLSRKQPLLILRKLPMISAIVNDDARTYSSFNRKGSIVGENLSGKRDVKFHGKMFKISVLHWGYSYTEPIWVSFLDVLSSMPREVLFTCGVKAGLLDLLTVYVQLVSVQLQLLSADKALRLKTKLTGAFTAFKQINTEAWMKWLVSDVDDSQMRHLLMSCEFISPQEAIDCIKK